MKRILILLAACLLCLPLACAKTPAPAPEPASAVTVPETQDVTLTLPLGTRDGIAKSLPAYTAGFSGGGEALTFAVVSSDPAVAEGVLRDDGTLYVIAHGTGEAKLTVSARTASGEENAASVSVTVRDARRMLVLIVLGVLSAALLILLGKPSAKQPETPAEAPEAPKEPTVIFEEPEEPVSSEEMSDPVAIFEDPEEPNDNLERS